jgi:hypothetical protein
VAVAAGSSHALALKRDGTIVGWGSNGNGQATPPVGLSNVVAISAGEVHSMALRVDGTVIAWGNPQGGETNVPAGLSNVVAIAAGATCSTALRSDGGVVLWGVNNGGELNIPPGLTNVIAISPGSRHVLALVNDGTPAIVRQPLSWTFYTGGQSNVILSAGAVGPSPLSLQWQRDGTNIVDATNSFLIFNNLQPEDSGAYRLVASNSHGTTASSNAVLAVIASKPIILNQPLDAYGLFGSNKTFNVFATGSLPITYQWQFNGTNITGATNSSLTLTSLDWTNAGPYSVVLSNSVGAVTSSNAYLTVIAADFATALNTQGLTWFSGSPAWFPETTVTHDGVAAAQSGASFGSSTLQTAVTGPGTLTFWWMFTPSASTSNTLTFSSTKGNVSAMVYSTSGWQQKTLYLATGSQTLSWTYMRNNGLVASTGWVDQVSYTPGATLPTVTSMSPDASVRPNANVTFSVNALGTPPLTYQWQLNGANLLNKTNATLNLTNVQPANAGIYTVVITNGFGITPTNVNLSVVQFGFNPSPGSLLMTSNGFQMELNGILTTNPVIIWGSTNLVNWLPLYTNPATTGSFQFLDVMATNLPARFYKAQE